MAVMAKWGGLSFQVSRKKIVALENLHSTSAIKKENKEQEGGTKVSEVTGFEPQEISFDFKVSDSVGVDVRKLHEQWKKKLGKSYPLYLNKRKFGPNKLRLESVDLSDVTLDNLGRMRVGKISVSFEEDALEPSNKTRIRNYVTIRQLSAAKVKASKTDKKTKKPKKIAAKKKKK